MAWLIVGGVTVPVRSFEPSHSGGTTIMVGGHERAIDGTMFSSVIDRKDEWSITSGPLTTTEKNNLVAALDGAEPITCSGDMLGASGSYMVERDQPTPLGPGGVDGWDLSFTLKEE